MNEEFENPKVKQYLEQLKGIGKGVVDLNREARNEYGNSSVTYFSYTTEVN